MLKERFSSALKPQPLFEPHSDLNTFQRTPEDFRSFDQQRPDNFRSNEQRKPEIFRSLIQNRPENFQNSFLDQENISPVNIFSRKRPFVPNNPLPPAQPQPFNGPFASTVPEIEEELESFRAEAEKANESAIKKQIEALKKIIASQNE